MYFDMLKISIKTSIFFPYVKIETQLAVLCLSFALKRQTDDALSAAGALDCSEA